MNNKLEVNLRDAKESDTNYLISVMAIQLQYTQFKKHVIKPIGSFFARAALILLFNHCDIKVAVAPNYPEVILGFIMYRDDTMFYVYVKDIYRGLGLGQFLVKDTYPEKKFNTVFSSTYWYSSKGIARHFDFKFNPKLLAELTK